MMKLLLPIAMAFLLSACAGTTGVVTPHCTHCAHHCEHCMTEHCEHCKTKNRKDAASAEEPCKICMESERASTAKGS